MERRVWTAAPALEVRADDMEDEDGKPVMRLRGYATVYGAKTELMWGMWRETVDDGAYDKSLAKDDIRTLWQHDTAQVLGRTSAGTMEAWSDKVGVGYATLPPSWAAPYVESVRRGDVTQSSIGFSVIDDEWGEDDELKDVWLRTIKVAKMWEASPVTWPAVEETSVEARSAQKLALPGLPADLEFVEEAGVMRIRSQPVYGGVDAAQALLARVDIEMQSLEVERNA